MNTQYSPRKTITLWAAIAGMILVATTAQANMLSPALYGDELDRCTVELRPELNTTGATRLQHTLTDIDKVGVWYVFEIRTIVFDDNDAVMSWATTHCKANRWTEETVVEVTNQPPAAGTRLASAD